MSSAKAKQCRRIDLATSATATALRLTGVNLAREDVVYRHVERDLSFGDFAQRGDALFVVGLHERLGVLLELQRSLRSEVHQREAIGGELQTVFNGNACHDVRSFVGAAANDAPMNR
ncbi:MAG: hypothetical protein ACI81R_003728 [Bradymonadia bacterium]|jgi:hypothetical protein